jgi:hypothetical protein
MCQQLLYGRKNTTEGNGIIEFREILEVGIVEKVKNSLSHDRI